jgi:ubiquinone/menaquinone biosynthesis C-methylase UbiE
MSEIRYSPEYLLDSDEEPLRLERQARMYGSEYDLRHLALLPSDRVLDASCGAGSVTRVIARAVPNGRATGIDREPKYIDFARRKAFSRAVRRWLSRGRSVTRRRLDSTRSGRVRVWA